MHLSSEPAPLRDLCDAPAELCDLVHQMLEKDPSFRPGAIEVRQMTRAIAAEQTSSYAEFELSGVEELPTKTRPVRVRPALSAPAVQSDEVVVVDPEALEFGVTEMVPVVRKPRWTPEIQPTLANGPASRAGQNPAITPRAARDQVAGEIQHKRRQ